MNTIIMIVLQKIKSWQIPFPINLNQHLIIYYTMLYNQAIF
jgi:hypothetical protein